MKTTKKAKAYYWVEKNITADKIRVVIISLLAIGTIISILRTHEDVKINDYIDFTVIFSVLILFLADIIARTLRKTVETKFEDYAKINSDVNSLVKKYSCEDLVTYDGKKFPGINLWRRENNDDRPIVVYDDPSRFYELPRQIAELSASVMKVHQASTIYNQINIRVDDVEVNESEIALHTSRTHFFDSMLTNRACDSILKDNMTIREIYEPGPYMMPLSMSKMSNHIGVNGLLITTDGWIPFVKRSSKVSVGKDTINCSISASLKTKYAVMGQLHKVTMDGLAAAIIHEVQDELNIPAEKLLEQPGAGDNADIRETVRNNVKKSIFAIYRDLSECGKPQLVACMNIGISKDDVIKYFYGIDKKQNQHVEKTDEELLRKDGQKVLFYNITELMNANIMIDPASNELRVSRGDGEHDKEEHYKINMATTIALAYLLEHLKQLESVQK